MKFKLLHKLFLANISIILMLVLGLLSFSYYSSKSVFNDFLHKMENKALSRVAQTLSDYYETNQSWDEFIKNQEIWYSTIITQLVKSSPITVINSQSGDGQKDASAIPDKVLGTALKVLSERISLLDKNKNVILYGKISSNYYIYYPITLNDEVISWLRLSTLEVENRVAAEHYFSSQLNIIYWAGLIGVLAAGLCSFYLSRGITLPIEKLNQGTKTLASRDFTFKIDVNTNDELQDLAENFNFIAQELSQYEIRQKQWIMDISHELRTPLTILQGEFEAITDGVSDYDSNMVISLKEEVMHISRLVNDLHELSVTDTLEFNYQHENVDIHLLLTNYLQRYQSSFLASDIYVYKDLEAAKVIVPGDVYRLAQVIKNLLDNSVRYIKSPGRLWIEAKQVDKYLQLDFHDSGPGVQDEVLTKLFDRLYRSDLSRNRKTGGSGIGLAICRNIITAHKGEIFASHSKKGGLCMTIKLPFSELRSY